MELNEMKQLGMENLSNGGPAILKEIQPVHPFRDGKRIPEEIVGRDVTVVFPANAYVTQRIRVSDPTDALSPLLARATVNEPVLVGFDNLVVSIKKRQRQGVWVDTLVVEATGVHVTNVDELLEIE